MSNSSPQSLIKSEILAIAYSVAAKQIIKISKSRAEANARLFKMGEQIGLRVADEYLERETNSYKPEEVTTVLLKGILKEYLGCEVTITNKDIKYQKAKFIISFRVVIKQNPISDFIIMGNSLGKLSESDQELNYHSMMLGFASGCMKSMRYHPDVKMVENVAEQQSAIIVLGKNQTMVDVQMWKEKEQD